MPTAVEVRIWIAPDAIEARRERRCRCSRGCTAKRSTCRWRRQSGATAASTTAVEEESTEEEADRRKKMTTGRLGRQNLDSRSLAVHDRRHANSINEQQSNRRASVLLLALVVIVLLTLGAMSFFERMFVEHQATRAHIRQTQSRYFAESGIEFIRALTMQDPDTLHAIGRPLQQPGAVSGPAGDRRSSWRHFAAGSRSSLPRLNEAGYFAGIRYGLENESSRLNLNTVLLADQL